MNNCKKIRILSLINKTEWKDIEMKKLRNLETVITSNIAAQLKTVVSNSAFY